VNQVKQYRPIGLIICILAWTLMNVFDNCYLYLWVQNFFVLGWMSPLPEPDQVDCVLQRKGDSRHRIQPFRGTYKYRSNS
jgi:hypothetical protein